MKFPVGDMVGLDSRPRLVFRSLVLLEVETYPSVVGPDIETVLLKVERRRLGPVNCRVMFDTVLECNNMRIVHCRAFSLVIWHLRLSPPTWAPAISNIRNGVEAVGLTTHKCCVCQRQREHVPARWRGASPRYVRSRAAISASGAWRATSWPCGTIRDSRIVMHQWLFSCRRRYRRPRAHPHGPFRCTREAREHRRGLWTWVGLPGGAAESYRIRARHM